MRPSTLLSLIAIVLVSAAVAGDALRAQAPGAWKYIGPRSNADATLPPFSEAVMIGNTLYLSGAIGIDAQRRVPDTAEGEAAAVLNSVKATLEKSGMTMDDLVSVQVFCSNVAHYDAFNKVYRTYFKQEFPARAFIGSGPLLFNARFEVQGIAVKR